MRWKPKRVRWRQRALGDLSGFRDWLASVDHGNSKQTLVRIRAAAESLKHLGDIGRPSIEPGLRELSVRNVPYVIVYRVDGDAVDILAVYHTAQRRG